MSVIDIQDNLVPALYQALCILLIWVPMMWKSGTCHAMQASKRQVLLVDVDMSCLLDFVDLLQHSLEA
jgi:hypothetical protein